MKGSPITIFWSCQKVRTGFYGLVIIEQLHLAKKLPRNARANFGSRLFCTQRSCTYSESYEVAALSIFMFSFLTIHNVQYINSVKKKNKWGDLRTEERVQGLENGRRNEGFENGRESAGIRERKRE